jgi:hypothetical protein
VQIAGVTCFILCHQRYGIVNGEVEVDGVCDEPASENTVEGKEPDGIKLNVNSFLVPIPNLLFVFKPCFQLKEFQTFGLLP